MENITIVLALLGIFVGGYLMAKILDENQKILNRNNTYVNKSTDLKVLYICKVDDKYEEPCIVYKQLNTGIYFLISKEEFDNTYIKLSKYERIHS